LKAGGLRQKSEREAQTVFLQAGLNVVTDDHDEQNHQQQKRDLRGDR
jgi:hypothetical protein